MKSTAAFAAAASLFCGSFLLSQLSLPPAIAQESSPDSAATSQTDSQDDASAMQPFEEVVKDTETIEGLFTLYRNTAKGKLYLEIEPQQLDRNYLFAITLSTGIGEAGLFRGMPLSDILFYFRRHNDRVHFVLPNVRFRTRPGDPRQQALANSFSDSVLYALPIKSIHPERDSLLIDLNDLLMNGSDLSGLTAFLPFLLGNSYSLDSNKSYFNNIQAFPQNLEIETVYGFSSGGSGLESMFSYLPTLPDSRAFSLGVHYSLSQLPANNGYRPRVADNRIGYFITAYRDISNNERRDPFVRYINRWHLEKQDPDAAISPPKQPIVFWIENTVPDKYRQSIREGILMWNRAFERAGFENAIEVRQMPDDATWNPADIRYNTIRWSSSFDPWFAGVGPSRVNPLTGEILDADILIDANIVRFIQRGYRTMVGSESSETGLPPFASLPSQCYPGALQGRDREVPQPPKVNLPVSDYLSENKSCFTLGSYQQFALGAMSLSLMRNTLPGDDRMDEYVDRFLRYLVAHEVGHTLGLRHNFHGSTLLDPEALHDPDATGNGAIVASVMDYLPANIAPTGQPQGEFFPTQIGPYDEWAIQYGYTPFPRALPPQERQQLETIAARAGEPQLSYGTDEDAYNSLDPTISTFDLSDDPLEYARVQMENARQIWSRLDKRYPLPGESYGELRVMFDMVLDYYFRQAAIATKYIGGQSFNRDRAGDSGSRLPFEPLPADKQRQALATLQQYIFAPNAFEFSPELLNKLAPSRWNHWGQSAAVFRLDYPIHENIASLQGFVLRSLLSGDRLTRLRDLELKTTADNALTLPELFETLYRSIWTEVLEADRAGVNISSIRRDLQRQHLELLADMVLRRARVPEDARTVAWYQLRQLEGDIDTALDKQGDRFDTYTKAHLQEARDRVVKALNAQLDSQ